MNTTIFTEAIDLSEATLDTPNRVLQGVVLIRAGESANKRDYPAAVLLASASVFEGVRAYANHPGKSELKERAERSIRDITGWYQNVRYVENKLVADRHFAPTQAGNDAWALAEMIATGRAPKTLAGLSINAVGKAKAREDGGLVIESITYAHSVDDVTTPAAGGSYIESTGGDLMTAFLQEMTFEEWYHARPDFTERVKKEMKTLRQEQALTDAQALAQRLQADLDPLQVEVTTLRTERDAALAESQRKAQQVVVVRLLAKTKLPTQWKERLEAELMNAAVDQWGALIERNISEAQSAGFKPQVPVNVPGPQTALPVQFTVQESTAPRDDEDAESYAKRMRNRKG